VVATAAGTVISAGWQGALGRAVKLRHGGEYVTIYGHLRGTARGIRRGTQVRQNQVIGYVGSTGRATGPHLHYTVQRFGQPIDPLKMKNPPAEPLDPALRPWLDETRRRWLRSLDSIESPALQARGDSDDSPDRSGG
jgi:murein DD-endopeptidase MepM/ murein hydrolase activator NlpD